MYRAYCDGALMYDSRIEELALVNPVLNLEENKAGSFSFLLPPEHSTYNIVKKRKSLIDVYQDDEWLWSGICIKDGADFFNQKNIYCEGELSFLNDSIQRPARYQGITVRGLLEAYIANHNAQVEEAKRFTVGVVTVTDPNDSLYCYTNMESTMQALKEDLVDDLGGFFRTRHENGVKYIDYLADSPNTNSQVIKIGRNLMDFTSNTDSSEIATAIIPLGAKLEESTVEGLETRLTIESVNNGLDYVYSQEAVDAYGWIFKTVEFDDVTTPEALKRKGEQYKSDIQYENMVIQAKAVDLHLTDSEIERFKLSDNIRVLSAPHGLDRFFRLTKLSIPLNNPAGSPITLGKDEKVTLSAKSNQASEEIKKAIEKIVPSSEILKQAAENATNLIATAMGGYIVKTENELLIMDTNSIETAKKVWRWNINGLGYSANGYAGPYELAMTMDGSIVADFIKVGTLSGDLIKGGTISASKILSTNADEETQIDVSGGQIVTYSPSTGYKGVRLKGQNIYIYSWQEDDNQVGSLGSVYGDDYGNSIALTSFAGDHIALAYKNDDTTSNVIPALTVNREQTGEIVAHNAMYFNNMAQFRNGQSTDRQFTFNCYGMKMLKNGCVVIDTVSTSTTAGLKFVNAEGTRSTTVECTGINVEKDGTTVIESNLDYDNNKIVVTNNATGEKTWFSSFGVDMYDSNGSCNTWIDKEASVLKNLTLRGTLAVNGTKSRVTETESFKDRLLYCYEMPTPFFGDIGEAVLDDTGTCYIYIDDVFLETIDTECMYQVFLQKYGEGECIIAERSRNHFIVKGTPGLVFAWEIKAKQAGYTMERLEEYTQEEKEAEINYEAEASAYLSEYERQVLSYE